MSESSRDIPRLPQRKSQGNRELTYNAVNKLAKIVESLEIQTAQTVKFIHNTLYSLAVEREQEREQEREHTRTFSTLCDYCGEILEYSTPMQAQIFVINHHLEHGEQA